MLNQIPVIKISPDFYTLIDRISIFFNPSKTLFFPGFSQLFDYLLV